ncbi:hypothetical protein [Actinomycetospora lemnae]|uniref:Uncharacterized protein n=1 Tax=Actinomycetospora lemnae TaxID=3019891 RepID=A0ABT5SXC8_9PSEU|nr:hypothetical protein [Actinomycetospora sp. DW7H6]MDD7967510.1 hypothetical protein [Actinomycetospora sp. DW7H6]
MRSWAVVERQADDPGRVDEARDVFGEHEARHDRPRAVPRRRVPEMRMPREQWPRRARRRSA